MAIRDHQLWYILLTPENTESGRKVGSLGSLSVVVESEMNPRAPNQRQASSTSPYSHPAPNPNHSRNLT